MVMSKCKGMNLAIGQSQARVQTTVHLPFTRYLEEITEVMWR